MGSRSLLQGIFPTQGLNPGLLHYCGVLDEENWQNLAADGKQTRVIRGLRRVVLARGVELLVQRLDGDAGSLGERAFLHAAVHGPSLS